MEECENSGEKKHHHKGRTSEQRVDKAAILGALDIAPGHIILDAGCGNGYMAKEFARLTGPEGRVYALDPDTETISGLKAEAVDTGIEAFVGDITQKTPLADASLDLIYLSTVFHGFSAVQITGFVDEVKRLLRPGGELAIVEMKKEPLSFGPPLEIKFSPDELCRAVGLPLCRLVEAGNGLYMQLFKMPG